MPASTVSSKGQVTIPKEIREVLGVEAGDRVQFVVRADGVVELRPETVDLLELVGFLVPRDGRSATIEQMNVAIRGSATKSFKRSIER